MRRCLSAGAVISVLATGVALAQELGPDVQAQVATVVAEGIPRELTRCKLQDALWGRYDVSVHVTMGSDGLPYLFELRNGQFTRMVDPKPVPGPTRFERTGHITAVTAEEAFARGLPFFIRPPEPLQPGAVAIQVLANPTAHVENATLLVLLDQPGVEDLVSLAFGLNPALREQRLTATHEALKGPVILRAAILADSGTTALMLGCVLSNEIEFRPAL